MTEQKLIELIRVAFSDAQVSVSLNGGHVDITVISADFAGMRPVARQQRVYAPLANLIADSTLHAVNISALTPDADG